MKRNAAREALALTNSISLSSSLTNVNDISYGFIRPKYIKLYCFILLFCWFIITFIYFNRYEHLLRHSTIEHLVTEFDTNYDKQNYKFNNNSFQIKIGNSEFNILNNIIRNINKYFIYNNSYLPLSANYLEITALPDYTGEKEFIQNNNHNQEYKEFFGATEIVNLEFRPQKWNTVRNILLKSNIFRFQPINRHLATYGKQIDLLDYYHKNKISKTAYRSLISPRKIGGFYMTPGGLGCFISHIKVWKKAIDLKRPIIVLEDDVELVPNFDTLFEKVLKDLPLDFGIFYFADMVHSEGTKLSAFDYDPNSSLYLLTKGEHWGTYAYMISPTTAQLLYENAFPILYQVDSYIIETCKTKNITVYRSKINLLATDNTQGRVSDVQISRDSLVSNNNTNTNAVLVKGRQRLVPMIFHVIDLPPINKTVKTLLNRLEKTKLRNNILIMKWNISNINDIFGWNKDLDPFQVIQADYNITYIDLLSLQFKILLKYGGMLLKADFNPRHAIGKVMHDVNGFIAYEEQITTVMSNNTSIHISHYEYPILGSISNDTNIKKIIKCMDTINNRNETLNMSNIIKEWKFFEQTSINVRKCIIDIGARFPVGNEIFLFPAEVLDGVGYE